MPQRRFITAVVVCLAAGTFGWIVVDLTLASFAQGDYVIEVVQGDSARVAAFRIIR